MPMITIDPDDTEMRDAINLVEKFKKAYSRADKDWNRSGTSMHAYTQQYDDYRQAKLQYESALINLALIVMSRL